jgi:hypothetical protein
VNRIEAAEPLLDEACPRAADQTLFSAWKACLDADYCGDRAPQRLEILERLLGARQERGSLFEVARIHLRHEVCPDSIAQMLERELATGLGEGRCELELLRGLFQSCRSLQREACDSFRQAQACARGAGDSKAIALAGAVIDPVSGAPLDLTDMNGTTEKLLASRCGQATTSH